MECPFFRLDKHRSTGIPEGKGQIRHYALSHIEEVLSWDMETVMPEKGEREEAFTFLTYALGNLYAAIFLDKLNEDAGKANVKASLKKGDFSLITSRPDRTI